MARPLRIEYEGAVYHVTTRGNERKPVFLDKEDRHLFLNLLQKVNERFHWLCHAYCLMDNHYHLVIETPEGNLSKGMRQLNGVYTQAFNKRRDRCGHIFQGRYKAVIIQKESHLLEVSRYVVLNPVRAGAVKSPERWPWSSYRATAGMEQPHAALTTEWILGQFAKTRRTAGRKYGDFVSEGIGNETVWKQLTGQVLLGDEEFSKGLGDRLKGHRDVCEIPKKQRYPNRPDLDQLFKERTARNKDARNRKIAEAVERFGYSQKEIADYLSVHYSTVSKVLKR
ncbi:MAG: transposase [Nitrospirota bacterium]